MMQRKDEESVCSESQSTVTWIDGALLLLLL